MLGRRLPGGRGGAKGRLDTERIGVWLSVLGLTLASTALAHAQPAGPRPLPPGRSTPIESDRTPEPPPDQEIVTAQTDASRPDHSTASSEEDRTLAPPAPILMPELAPRSRLVISPMVSSALLINLLQLGATGTVAVGQLELFGEARARAAHVFCIDCRGGEGAGPALGNLRAGARYHFRAGSFRIAPSVWAWLPTSNASAEHAAEYSRMTGVEDWRAYGPYATALGVAVDVGWYGDATFAQLEVGTALVSDDGPQIDNVFGAFGYGKQVTPRTSFLAEWRVDVLPTGERMHGPALGFGRGDGSASSWRMRFHPYVFDDFEWGGLAVGLDFLRRF